MDKSRTNHRRSRAFEISWCLSNLIIYATKKLSKLISRETRGSPSFHAALAVD